MKTKEYQNVIINFILFSNDDCIRTSGDADETQRIPFMDGSLNSSNFGE